MTTWRTTKSMKTMLRKILIAIQTLVLALLMLPSFAKADRIEMSQRGWAELLKNGVQLERVRLTQIDLATNELPAAIYDRLTTIVEDQAQIWGDTILEGDYYAEEAVKLDSIELVRANDIFLGYRVTYSSVAFETADCRPEDDMQSCTKGRIVESSFVSPNLNSWIRDERAMAEFVPERE